jgi:hypothetical protein
MTTQTEEQQLFAILAEVNNKFRFREDRFEAYGELVPNELSTYIKHNSKNKRAISRLTAYLYLTMEEEFNQYFIENDLDNIKITNYKGEIQEEETYLVGKIIADLEDDLRSYERGDHKNLKK